MGHTEHQIQPSWREFGDLLVGGQGQMMWRSGLGDGGGRSYYSIPLLFCHCLSVLFGIINFVVIFIKNNGGGG